MNSFNKEQDKKKKMPKTTFGGLPAGPPDMANLVTTEQSSPDVPRSMGGVAVMPPPTTFGGSSFFPTTFAPPPSFAGTMAPPSLHSGGAKGVSQMGKAKNSHMPCMASSPATSAWNITDENIPTLPQFHPLERSATFVPHTAAPTVALRVVKVLRSRSIESTFYVEKAKVKCLTEDNVEFRVRLYRGRNQNSHGIIVEVQRRFGFSPGYQANVTAILDAAEGKVPDAVDTTVPSMFLPQDTSLVDDDEEEAPGLEIATSLVCGSNTFDAKALGFQSLASLTDDKVVGSIRAQKNSEQLLSRESESLRSELWKVLSPPGSTGKSLAEQEGLNRTHAISAVCNATHNSRKTEQYREYFLQTVLPLLITEIGNASATVQTANLAASALLSLLKSGDDFVKAACRRNVIDTLHKAEDVGNASHASLANNASACIGLVSPQ